MEQEIIQINNLFDHYESLESASQELMKIMSKENAMDYSAIILRHGTNPYIVMGGIKIIENYLINNWNSFDISAKKSLRRLCKEYLKKFDSNPQIHAYLVKIFIYFGIRMYPAEYTGFLPKLISKLGSNFELFSEYLLQFTYPINWKIPTDQAETIKEFFIQNSLQIFTSLIHEYKLPFAVKALERFLPFCRWSIIGKSPLRQDPVFIQIFTKLPDDFQGEPPLIDFHTICTTLLLEDIPISFKEGDPSFALMFLNQAFEKLSQLCRFLTIQVPDVNFIRPLLPVLQRYMPFFESQSGHEYITCFHSLLIKFPFEQLFDYWHDFTLSIFEDFKLHDNTSRYTIHHEIFNLIRDALITHMIKPPEFVIPGIIDDMKTNQQEILEYAARREMVVAYLTISPKEVFQCVNEMISTVSSAPFDETNFLYVIYLLACISGTTNSHLEDVLVVSSLQFILNVYKKIGNVNTDENITRSRSIIASSFLYLAASYSKAQKLTGPFCAVTMRLTLQSLAGRSTSQIANRTLLYLSKYSSTLIKQLPTLPPLDPISTPNSFFTPEQFDILVEAYARIYHTNGRVNELGLCLNARWDAAVSAEFSPSAVDEMRMVIIGFSAISRVVPSIGLSILKGYKDQFIAMIKQIGDQASTNFKADGPDIADREDMIIILGFLKAITQFYVEVANSDCGDILGFYSNFPDTFKAEYIEAVRLCERLLKTNLPQFIVDGIHSTVIEPTEILVLGTNYSPSETLSQIQSNPALLLCPDENISHNEHFEVLTKALGTMAQSYFKSLNNEDINFLIVSLRSLNQTAVFSAISALDAALTRADLEIQGESRNHFFSNFMPSVLLILFAEIANSSHDFCYKEMFNMLTKWCKNIAFHRIEVILDENEDHIKGLANFLAESITTVYPNMMAGEMVSLFELMLKNRTPESYQDLIIQFIARARQTTNDETLRHLKIQNIIESIHDSFL